MLSRHAGTVLTLLAAGLPTARPVRAQIIPIRTVPVASGDQFLVLPSSTLAMGGVRVAVDDSLADGWTNPAKGVLTRASAFLASPTFYSISGGGGGGRTFPVGGLLAGERWFGGVAMALQQIDNSRGQPPSVWLASWSSWDQPERLSDASSRNLYATGYLGRRLGDGWSIGLGLSASDLQAMDGVDLLYAGADRIEQSGDQKDFRMGVYHEGRTDRLSLLLVHSRLSMTHRVAYSQWIYDPELLQTVYQQRVDKNEEKSRTWGGQLTWSRDLTAPGWRVGGSATVNHKAHPKIPDYDIQHIPRDPGNTWAYEGAVGVARELGPTTFAVDVAFQPIWSDTWQEADAADVVASGGRLRVGDRSVDNGFFFTNVMLRAGISHRLKRTTLQAGLEMRSYSYRLDQVDNVSRTEREQTESWMEWTPTIGALFSLSGVDVRYLGRITEGTGRPGLDWSPVQALDAVSQTAGGDFLVAPQGPLTLQDASVITHQISVRVLIH